MALRLATLCVLAFPSVLCTPKEPGALTKDGFCCCDSSSQCESGNCVKGWCQAQGFVDQTAQGMTAGRHAVLNTPVQTAGHPSSTAAAIAALAPGSLEPLTVLLQTGLVASAKAGVASASLSPVERLHWEKHNSPLPPDPPPVTAPAAAAPVAAVAAHFEPESTKVAASAPKRATPAVAAPAVAARPHAGAAAVDAAAALAAAHATVFTTTALADAVAAKAQLRFKALRASASASAAASASLRLRRHHRDQQQHTAATRALMSEPPVIIPGAGYNPIGAVPVDAAANFHPIPVVHGSIQDAKPEPRTLFLEGTPPGDDQERKQAKAREEAVEGIEEKGEEQVKAVRKTEANFRQRRVAALDFSKELRVERDASRGVLPRFQVKSTDRSGATAMPLGPGLTKSESTFMWERTRKIGFNAHSWKEDNEDHGCPHVQCCADPCDCKCGEAKGALVYCPTKGGKLGCVAASELPSDLDKRREACTCPPHPETQT